MGSEISRRESLGESTAGIDDLKRIQGIGPVIERQLYDAGILTYSHLAALSAEQIARLVADLPLLSVERIARQDWPGQARALAAELAQATLGDAVDSLPTDSPYATFTIELLLNRTGNVQRTRVVYMQGDKEEQWSGWNEEHLLRFLTEHVGVEGVSSTKVAPMAAPGSGRKSELLAGFSNGAIEPGDRDGLLPPASGEAPDAAPTGRSVQPGGGVWRLEIGDLVIDENPHDRHASIFPAVPRVRAHLGYRLGGSGAQQLVARALRFIIQVVATELASGRTIVLAAEQGQLIANQFEYLSTLEFALPDDGRYQLVGTVLIADAGLVGSTLGPVLRVVP